MDFPVISIFNHIHVTQQNAVLSEELFHYMSMSALQHKHNFCEPCNWLPFTTVTLQLKLTFM